MFNEHISATVIDPIDLPNRKGFVQPLNYAKIDGLNEYCYIMDIDHPITDFSGKIIAALIPKGESTRILYTGINEYKNKYATNGRKPRRTIWIAASPSSRYINVDIENYLDMKNHFKDYNLVCLYEASAGALVYKNFNGTVKYLLIRNKNSSNWGFPKGHIERGETKYDTAKREVFEETGLKIKIHLGYEGISNYKVHDLIEKQVSIFTGVAVDRFANVVPQASEIDEYIWLPFDQAMKFLTYPNDKQILNDAVRFLINGTYIYSESTPNLNPLSYQPDCDPNLLPQKKKIFCDRLTAYYEKQREDEKRKSLDKKRQIETDMAQAKIAQEQLEEMQKRSLLKIKKEKRENNKNNKNNKKKNNAENGKKNAPPKKNETKKNKNGA